MDNYYIIKAVPWEEDLNGTGPEVSTESLRTILELLHLIQRPDNASRLHEAAKAVGYNPWELARFKEAMADATEVLDGIADQINRLERMGPVEHICETCAYFDELSHRPPCCECMDEDKWEPKP